jgi:hypothetical protein
MEDQIDILRIRIFKEKASFQRPEHVWSNQRGSFPVESFVVEKSTPDLEHKPELAIGGRDALQKHKRRP